VAIKHVQEDGPLRVLFIGNSFTARNDMPRMIAHIATAAGRQFNHRLISAGGASLRRHWNKGDAQKAIQSRDFDYVVLQEQSTLPIKDSARMYESVRLFDDGIKSAGSKTALYMTWARQHAPETQRTISEAYTSIASEIGATLVPVGMAWERCMRDDGAPVLYDKDGSHPTVGGSYLAACVFYATLFGKGLPANAWHPEEVDIAKAKALQQVAMPARPKRGRP